MLKQLIKCFLSVIGGAMIGCIFGAFVGLISQEIAETINYLTYRIDSPKLINDLITPCIIGSIFGGLVAGNLCLFTKN